METFQGFSLFAFGAKSRLPVPQSGLGDGPVLDDPGWFEAEFFGREKGCIPVIERSKQNSVNPKAIDEQHDAPRFAWTLDHQTPIIFDNANSVLFFSLEHWSILHQG